MLPISELIRNPRGIVTIFNNRIPCVLGSTKFVGVQNQLANERHIIVDGMNRHLFVCRETACVQLTSPFNMRVMYDDKLTFNIIESTSQTVGRNGCFINSAQ